MVKLLAVVLLCELFSNKIKEDDLIQTVEVDLLMLNYVYDNHKPKKLIYTQVIFFQYVPWERKSISCGYAWVLEKVDKNKPHLNTFRPVCTMPMLQQNGMYETIRLKEINLKGKKPLLRIVSKHFLVHHCPQWADPDSRDAKAYQHISRKKFLHEAPNNRYDDLRRFRRGLLHDRGDPVIPR